MRRLKTWDVAAAVLVVAVGVPYIGYLVRGSMPFIEDARGMSAAGLVLGLFALAATWLAARPSRFEIGLGTATVVMGIVALALAETSAAEVLLAVFMGMILVTVVEEILIHANVLSTGNGRQTLRS